MALLLVKAGQGGNRTLLNEVHGAHPGGVAWVKSGGGTYLLGDTTRVGRLIRDGHLQLLQEVVDTTGFQWDARGLVTAQPVAGAAVGHREAPASHAAPTPVSEVGAALEVAGAPVPASPGPLPAWIELVWALDEDEEAREAMLLTSVPQGVWKACGVPQAEGVRQLQDLTTGLAQRLVAGAYGKKTSHVVGTFLDVLAEVLGDDLMPEVPEEELPF